MASRIGTEEEEDGKRQREEAALAIRRWSSGERLPARADSRMAGGNRLQPLAEAWGPAGGKTLETLFSSLLDGRGPDQVKADPSAS